MKNKECLFCRRKIEELDYKDTAILSKFLNPWGKIKPASDTGVCAKHQRRLAEAIKRARYLALLAYISR